MPAVFYAATPAPPERELVRFADAVGRSTLPAADLVRSGTSFGSWEAVLLIAIGSDWLGVLSCRLGRYDDAREHLDTALTIQQVQDRFGEAAALYGLGTVHQRLGDYQAALDHKRRALAIFRQCGDRIGEGRVLNNLGTTLERMGRDADAFDH